MRCVPHSPTGVIGDARRAARAARCPTCRPSARGPRRSCLRGTPRRTRRCRSASTAACSASAASTRPRRTGIWCAARSSVPEHGLVEQLGLGEEPHVAAAAVGDPRQRQRIEIRHVVAREDRRARRRDVLARPRSSIASPTAARARTRPSPRNTRGPRSVAYARHVGPAPFPHRRRRRPVAVVRARARPASRTRSTTTRADAFARTMAERVVAAAGRATGRDRDERARGRRVGARRSASRVVADPGSLDGAADAGRDVGRASSGLARVVVMHADLPLATSLDGIADDGGAPVAVIVPDHRDDGNPVLAIPSRGRLRVRVRPRLVRAPHRRGRARRARGPHRARPRARLRHRRRRPTSPRSSTSARPTHRRPP